MLSLTRVMSAFILGASGASSTATLMALTTILYCPPDSGKVNSFVLVVLLLRLSGVLCVNVVVWVKSLIPTLINFIKEFPLLLFGVYFKLISLSSITNPLSPHEV